MIRYHEGIVVTFFIAKKVTMVRPPFTQPCATAHQPNLVAQNTHLRIRAFLSHSVCFLAFSRFMFCFLQLLRPIVS
jgi:hypothetical protein